MTSYNEYLKYLKHIENLSNAEIEKRVDSLNKKIKILSTTINSEKASNETKSLENKKLIESQENLKTQLDFIKKENEKLKKTLKQLNEKIIEQSNNQKLDSNTKLIEEINMTLDADFYNSSSVDKKMNLIKSDIANLRGYYEEKNLKLKKITEMNTLEKLSVYLSLFGKLEILFHIECNTLNTLSKKNKN